MSAPPSFSEVLKRQRLASSLTQEELARRAQITVKAVSALERGTRRTPFPHTVRSLAEALELDERHRAELIASVPRRGERPVVMPTRGRPDPTRPVVPLVGRDGDASVLERLLRTPTRRLVTVTGPPGVGKTTLALLVADRVRSAYPDGVVVVDLADVTRPSDVAPAITRAIGGAVTAVHEARGFHGPETDGLVGLVGRRRLLLVLDTMEHLPGWAPELATFVRRCPRLVVVVTGRSAVGLRDERVVAVPPLDDAAATQLFHERLEAAGVVPEREAASALEALRAWSGGLPLAIELAAAATAACGARGLVGRMGTASDVGPRDRPRRHRSMDAALVWSHRLLTASARRLLVRLSEDAGTFSTSTAEALDGEDPTAARSALAELVRHSLVVRVPGGVQGDEHFRVLEPVRRDATARGGSLQSWD